MAKSKYHTPHDPIRKKARKTWNGMFERCYDPKTHVKFPTYIGCTVAEEWHDFEVFYSWFLEHYTNGAHLDKDLTVLGNKVYSPDACSFVPRWLNNLLLDSASSRGEYPIGVTKDRGAYKARFSCNGTSVYLGCFKTVEEASAAYQKAKGDYLINSADREGVPAKVRDTLICLGKQMLGEDHE